MNLEQLQSVRDSERKTDRLQELRESFYADAGELVAQLREKREQAAARADDPYDDPDVKRLTDEIESVEQTVEAIYEKRVGKLVKAASLAAADMPAGTEGMTTEETQLFETLVDDIEHNRQLVFDALSGETTDSSDTDERPDQASSPEPTAPEQTDSQEGSESPRSETDRTRPGSGTDPAEEPVRVADAMGGPTDDSPTGAARDRDPDTHTSATDRDPATDQETGRSTEQKAGTERRSDSEAAQRESTGGEEGRDRETASTVDRETVRITDDVGAIFGVDEREYDLSADDVVQLPAANAKPLVEQGAAKRLE